MAEAQEIKPVSLALVLSEMRRRFGTEVFSSGHEPKRTYGPQHVFGLSLLSLFAGKDCLVCYEMQFSNEKFCCPPWLLRHSVYAGHVLTALT